MKKALIFGATGQDGSYLAKLLTDKGYQVTGTSRNTLSKQFHLEKNMAMLPASITDFRSVMHTINKVEPDEIYNLAGQTSVGLSYDQPVETIESIVTGTLNILESIKFLNPRIKFYNAGSSESFGNTQKIPANEKTPFNPVSPYAVAKACAANLVSSYRKSYNLFACTGFLFNHESPLRPDHFVTKKIINSAFRISTGKQSTLQLGTIDIYRDWGWAPEYVEAMNLMLQNSEATDLIIATGKTVSLSHFLELAFDYYNLDWKNHVSFNKELQRPSDIPYSSADPSLAKSLIGWEARTKIEKVVELMCEASSMSLKV